MQVPHASDKSRRGIVRARDLISLRRRPGSESGQATTEFALILPIFLLLVGAIIQFGIGLNYWLDLQRIANQGARWAAVNNWPPYCPQGSASCTGANSLQATLHNQLLTRGEQNATVSICYPAADPSALPPYSGQHVGDPVRVRLERPFNVIGIPFLGGGLGSITIRGSATMRLEVTQDSTDPGATPLITGATAC
jgi:hypothetical protein